MKRKGDSKAQLKFIGEVLDGDELTIAILENYPYLKNYM